ncbi:MAG: AraC family ligand binding domain-containing protein, partial [Lentisphaeria bacterium]
MTKNATSNLINCMGRLPAPANYYLGQVADCGDLPNNVLVFARSTFSTWEERHDSAHHRFMLVVALRGTGELCVNERLLRLNTGETVVLFPHQLHHYINTHEERHWLFLTFEQAAAEPLLPLRNRTVRLTPAAFATL